MKRQVVKPVESQRARSLEPPQNGDQGDNYLDRLLKLIPGETVAMYLFLEGVLASALVDDPTQLKIWLWSIVGILAVGNLFYLKQYQSVTDSLQLFILTAAFFVWVLTIGGPFEYIEGYRPFMGSVILGLFTFFVPLFYKGEAVND